MTIEEQNEVEVTIKIKVKDLNICLSALGNEPHSIVDHIIQSLKRQSIPQLQEIIKQHESEPEDEK